MTTGETKSKLEVPDNGISENGSTAVRKSTRLNILKTYKIYIDGKFPRTESGRYYILNDAEGKQIANICKSSRKDFRDAVVAARKAQPGWAAKTAYNKGQILYRMAEVLEGRKAQFIEELVMQGSSAGKAKEEVNISVDRLVYYAGWTDKFIQVFSSVNPVESSHFNFSIPEPMGVVSAMASEGLGLSGLISVMAPVIAGGNAIVLLASESRPLCAVTLAEVLQTSDLPGGVVNLLTGNRAELLPHFTSHMDVNAVAYCGNKADEVKTVQSNSALNVKRALIYSKYEWMNAESQSPYLIMDFQEIKTTWHPIGQ